MKTVNSPLKFYKLEMVGLRVEWIYTDSLSLSSTSNQAPVHHSTFDPLMLSDSVDLLSSGYGDPAAEPRPGGARDPTRIEDLRVVGVGEEKCR